MLRIYSTDTTQAAIVAKAAIAIGYTWHAALTRYVPNGVIHYYSK